MFRKHIISISRLCKGGYENTTMHRQIMISGSRPVWKTVVSFRRQWAKDGII